MSLRFRKSFKVAPGVKLNLNKKSASVTFGGKGFHHTINSSGRKTTSVGIPGTGLYYQDVSTSGNSHSSGSSGTTNNQEYDNNDGDKKHHPILLWFLLLFIPPAGLIYLWTNKIQYSRRKRTILSAIFGFYAICWICAFIPGSGSDNSTSTTALVQEQTTTAVQPELQSTVSTTEATENTTAIIESSDETVAEPDIIVAQENENVAEPEVESETEAVTEPETEPATERTTAEKLVWITDTGKHYHSKKSCGNSKTSHQVPLSKAEARNLTPCQHCYR